MDILAIDISDAKRLRFLWFACAFCTSSALSVFQPPGESSGLLDSGAAASLMRANARISPPPAKPGRFQ